MEGGGDGYCWLSQACWDAVGGWMVGWLQAALLRSQIWHTDCTYSVSMKGQSCWDPRVFLKRTRLRRLCSLVMTALPEVRCWLP
jgi:hypothetical protein